MDLRAGGEGADSYEEVMLIYNGALRQIQTKLSILNDEFQHVHNYNPIEHIKARLKTPESIAEKLQRKDYDVDFDTAVTALNDISGVRCICYSVKEIYWIARQIGKTDTYTVVKAKDYIRKPKKNGYESYHIVLDIPMSYKGKTTVVRVELQLRTMIMDAWAGMDNRVSYKKGVPPEMERRIEKYARIGRRLDKLIQKTLDDSKTV